MTTTNSSVHKPPIDHASRADAIDPRRSIIIQAPAGSGKTSLLVQRFLVLLGQVEKPEEILAITFTRKATAEMRERVLNALRGIREDGSEEDDPELLRLGRLARDNDRQRDWQLQKNVQRIRIQTIDSLCSELVRCMPWSARFGAPPVLLESPRDLYREAASLTLDRIEDQGDPEIAKACAALIGLRDSNRQSAVDMLAAMLGNRDQWMRLGRFDREHVEGWWQQTIGEALEECNKLLAPEVRADLAQLSRYAANRLAEYRLVSATAGDAAVDQCIDMEAFPDCHWDKVTYWRGMAAILLTKNDNQPYKSITVRHGFPNKDDFQKEQKDKVQLLIRELKENPELLAAWQRIPGLPDGTFTDQQWRNTEALLKLLPAVAAELRLLFNQRNEADYTELAQRADMALGREDQPTDLALVLDYRLQHLLVDEFQDTSSGQLELLTKLVAGWTGDDGRSLFLVGDPMQSIYRFREAEVANFLYVQNEGLGALRPETRKLQCNFRSSAPLVHWFNHVFQQVMPGQSDILLGAVEYSPSVAHKTGRADGTATVHAAIDRDDATEARQIADLIETTLQNFGSDTVAVLGRSRKHLGALVVELDRRGIPYQGVKLKKLAERQPVQDLLALTLALMDPADRISWLGVLRSPWLGATLEELSLLCEGKNTRTVLALLEDIRNLDGVSPERRAQFEALATVMQQGVRQRNRLPIHINLEACWLRLGGPAMVAQDDLENCRRYIQLVEQLSTEGLPVNRVSLEEAMEELHANTGGEQPLKLMTIHAAKGLEFDTVILPRLHDGKQGFDSHLLRWKTWPDRILIAPRKSSTENENRHFDMIGKIGNEHSRNELGRLLYVACTRAQKRLHLFASCKEKDTKDGPQLPPPQKNSLLSVLWPAVEADFQEALDNQVETGERHMAGSINQEETTLAQCPADWRLPDIDSGVGIRNTPPVTAEYEPVEYDWAQNIARIVGIVTHQSLQEIEQQGWDKWVVTEFGDPQQALWRNRLVRHGLNGDELDRATALIETTLERARQDSAANWIFSSAHSDVHTEWSLAGVIGGVIRHVVLDRSFVDAGGTRWVVDFKTSRHESETDIETFLEQEKQRYAGTMNRYAAILANLEDRPVRKALYYPALQRLVELQGPWND